MTDDQAQPARLVWWCPDCRATGAADEDGCCTTCGADCEERPAPPTDDQERDLKERLTEALEATESGRIVYTLPLLRDCLAIVETGHAKKADQERLLTDLTDFLVWLGRDPCVARQLAEEWMVEK